MKSGKEAPTVIFQVYAAEHTVLALSEPVRHSGLFRGVLQTEAFRAEGIMFVLWVCCCAEFFWGNPERWGAEGFCSHTLCLEAHLCFCCVVYIVLWK